jgi:hypothetical protein
MNWSGLVGDHLTDRQIAGYCRKTLMAMDLLEVDDHLAGCDSCREQAIRARQVLRLFATSSGDLEIAGAAVDVHPDYEQLVDYIDDELNPLDQRVVEGHIESCIRCAEEADDLRAFKSKLAAAPVTEITAAPRIAAVAFWRQPRYRIAFQVAAAVAAVLLGGVLATLALHGQIRELRGQVSELQGGNSLLQQEYDTARSDVSELQSRVAQLQEVQGPAAPNVGSIALSDGVDRVTLSKDGVLTGLGSLPAPYVQAVKDALLTRRVETPPELAEVAGKAGALIGGKGEGVSFALQEPVGTAVLTDRPTFRWNSLDGASGYTVTVYDADFNPVAASEPLSATRWRIPKALARGRVYTWQVVASKGTETVKSPTPPAPEARFLIVDQSKAGELERIGRDYKGRHLTLGVIYAEAGLLDDAERELKALSEGNPHSNVARQLLLSVRAKRK